MKLIYKLVQGLEKLGKKVRETLAKILAGVNCSGRLRNTNISNLIIGVTSIVALIVVIIAFSSPHLSNPNMYFWVHSTIIQAFAAMIALTAIFLRYRLEMLKPETQV